MSILVLEKMGYVLWEGLVLTCVLFGSVGFVVLRRKMSGRPAFTNQDRNLLFNTPVAAESTPKFYLRFGLAVFLFCCIGVLEILFFAPLGAAILSVSLLLSCAGIVNMTLL
jgi:hypothetical protein